MCIVKREGMKFYMDLIQNIPENNNKKVSGIKIGFIIVIILIILLIVAAGAIWIYSQRVASSQFKFNLDGRRQNNYSNNMFIFQENKVYISIRDIAPLLGYNVYNGGYGEYTEDRTKCYVNNSKEIVSFELNSNKIYKYNATTSGDSESQTFNLDEPIIASGSNLYISSEGIGRAFNVMFNYNQENNEVAIFSLGYLANYYSGQISNAAIISDSSSLSESVIYNNQKALLYNMIVIKDSSTNLYGVASLSDPTSVIIGTRYASIEFMEGSNDFIVKTSQNKMGIIGNDGITKVRLEYDDIKELDKNLGLYLVTSNNRQGVVNSNGKIIVYQDYDQIGLPNTINDTNVTNKYILFDNCIPVERNDKWGLIDINGNEIAPMQYDGFGCDADTSVDSRYTDVLIIPELNGIVVELDEVNGNTRNKKYGVITADGNLFINIVLDNIYALTTQGETTYYASVQGQIIDLVDFVRQQQTNTSQNNENNISNNNQVNNVQTNNT